MSTVVGGIVAPAMWSVGWLRRLCGGGWFVKSDFTSPLDRVKCVNVLLKCVFIKQLVFMNYGLRAFYNFSNVWFDVGGWLSIPYSCPMYQYTKMSSFLSTFFILGIIIHIKKVHTGNIFRQQTVLSPPSSVSENVQKMRNSLHS